MSFSFDASKNQANVTTANNAPATVVAALPTFSFGGTGAGDVGKTLSSGFPLMSTPAQNKSGGLFTSGLSTAATQNTGFSLGSPNVATSTLGSVATSQPPGLAFCTPATSTPGLTFGTPGTAAPTAFSTQAQVASTIAFGLGNQTPSITTPTSGLTFGVPKLTTVTGFSLGSGEPASTATSSGLTFGTPMTASTGFSLGSTPTATTSSATTTTASFNLGSNITSTTASLDPAKNSTAQTGFSLAPTTLQADSGFGTSAANTTATTGFSITAAGTTAATPGFSFGTGTTAASTTGFSLNKTAAVSTSLTAPSTQISLATTTTVSSSASATQPAPINFFQLEDSINKWTLELEEQEKVFVNQATQVNAWDKLLITNGEKIVTLNQEVERVKIEQQQLEHELDYVVGQQKELQDCLVPLEKELASLSVSDPEREYTYRLAESLDTQLKRMSEDLKEIIEHLNQANRTQDSSDPIVQIGKILNAHTNSLQWLDQQTALLSQKIQQIDQMHQNFRQENERSFNLAYN